MASLYSDLDISFSKIASNDIGQISDINSIKNTLLNNLLIDSSSLPFNNSGKSSIYDYLHEKLDYYSAEEIKTYVRNVAIYDPRIISIEDIKIVEDPDNYKLNIYIALKVNLGAPVSTILNLDINKIE